ncbi:hypothetical protein [uncultured Desulfuromusa sp.]|uniref:hypothetical protein n=1 Tax=uncultured Desulfuromusa sp. TaxID=219183 RepID=UPI002AA68CA0|nr:hypothetical protein [uncultured Desulfuromusa sp.]
MDKTIAMQVIFWWVLAQLGSLLIKAGYSRSTLGTRYQTEKKCQACREKCQAKLKAAEDERLKELRKIRVLLIQLAIRAGIEIDTIEEVIK